MTEKSKEHKTCFTSISFLRMLTIEPMQVKRAIQAQILYRIVRPITPSINENNASQSAGGSSPVGVASFVASFSFVCVAACNALCVFGLYRVMREKSFGFEVREADIGERRGEGRMTAVKKPEQAREHIRNDTKTARDRSGVPCRPLLFSFCAIDVASLRPHSAGGCRARIPPRGRKRHTTRDHIARPVQHAYMCVHSIGIQFVSLICAAAGVARSTIATTKSLKS